MTIVFKKNTDVFLRLWKLYLYNSLRNPNFVHNLLFNTLKTDKKYRQVLFALDSKIYKKKSEYKPYFFLRGFKLMIKIKYLVFNSTVRGLVNKQNVIKSRSG